MADCPVTINLYTFRESHVVVFIVICLNSESHAFELRHGETRND